MIDPIVEKFDTAIRGTECRVIVMGDTVVKVYSCPRKCMNALEQQKLAAKHGLGPDVYGNWFEIFHNGETYYCYNSERVEVLKPKLNHRNRLQDVCELDGQYEKELNYLFNKLSDIGIDIETLEDLHAYNIGWKNGKVVCIDFGRSS